MSAWVKRVAVPASEPVTQAGAVHCSPYRTRFGFLCTAAWAIESSYPALQLMLPGVGSMLGSAPSVEFVPPPISSFRICSEAP